MTKRKYLRKLRKALGRIPESEKEELIEYYSEIIDESYERGKTTREIFATLETPEQVASDYFNANEGRMDERKRPRRGDYPRRDDYARRDDYPRRDEYFSRGRDDDYEERRRERSTPKEKKKPNVILTVLLFPIWFPLFMVAFSLALAASIVIIALLIADVIVTVALFVSALYCLIASFGLIPAHGTLAITQIGAALVLFGLAMLFELSIKPLGKGVGAFFRLLFRRNSSSGGAVAQSNWVAVLVVGLIFLLIGGGMGGFGFHALGDDWHNLAVVGDITEQEQVVELTGGAFTFDSDNLRVNVEPTDGDTARLVYYECEDMKLEYSNENGNVSLKSGAWSRNPLEYFKQCWQRGILFSAVVSDYVRATVYLPVSYEGDITLKVNNGALLLNGFGGENNSFGNVTLTTDNGMVSVEGLNAKKLFVDTDNGYIALDGVNADAVECHADNGYVKLKNVSAQTVNGVTQNGAITCERVNAENITLKTSNGAINGTIVGAEGDFRITANVGNGSCNLKDTDTGNKLLSVKTGNGAIKLSFVA